MIQRDLPVQRRIILDYTKPYFRKSQDQFLNASETLANTTKLLDCIPSDKKNYLKSYVWTFFLCNP